MSGKPVGSRAWARYLTLAVACWLALSACAGTQAQSSTQPPAGNPAQAAVNVSLKSYSVTPNPASAKAGSVTFNVSNDATGEQHEFVVFKTDSAADQLPLGSDGNVDEAAAGKVDEIEPIDAGKTGTLTVDLAAGHYVLICNRPGHYKLGMHSDFTVNP